MSYGLLTTCLSIQMCSGRRSKHFCFVDVEKINIQQWKWILLIEKRFQVFFSSIQWKSKTSLHFHFGTIIVKIQDIFSGLSVPFHTMEKARLRRNHTAVLHVTLKWHHWPRHPVNNKCFSHCHYVILQNGIYHNDISITL